jgi:hypothetical protein
LNRFRRPFAYIRLGLVANEARQINLYRSALARLAINFNVARGLPHEAIDLTEAKASTPTDFLCSEERLERSLDGFGIHADSVTGDGDHHVLTRAYRFTERRDIGVVEIAIGRFDRDLAITLLVTLSNRITRIEDEIEQRILQFVSVGESAPQSCGKHRFERDRFPQGPLQ